MGHTLIPHTSTPTGFGIRQRTNGKLRPISKCCGRMMSGDRSRCLTCGIEYHFTAHRLNASLSNDISLNYEHYLLESWLRKVTGWPDLEIEVTR